MATTLPALQRIRFGEDHKKEGMNVIMRAGTVVWTKEPGVYLVEPLCIEALQEKGVPFVLVEQQTVSPASR